MRATNLALVLLTGFAAAQVLLPIVPTLVPLSSALEVIFPSAGLVPPIIPTPVPLPSPIAVSFPDPVEVPVEPPIELPVVASTLSVPSVSISTIPVVLPVVAPTPSVPSVSVSTIPGVVPSSSTIGVVLVPAIVPNSSSLALPTPTALLPCQCPQVKCSAINPFALCACVNARESACKERCPDHKPIYLPCPIPPPPIINLTKNTITDPITNITVPAQSRPVVPACNCPWTACAQVWPLSCYCGNAAKMRCYWQCGGALPELQDCPDPVSPLIAPLAPVVSPLIKAIPPLGPIVSPLSVVIPSPSPIPTSLPKPSFPVIPPLPISIVATVPLPVVLPVPISISLVKPTLPTPSALARTNPVCGGFRLNNSVCAKGLICIKDPTKSGCGPDCDAPGICVPEQPCGGFTGLPCELGRVCVDDPRDSCDPKKGGADCSGLCMWPIVPLGGPVVDVPAVGLVGA